MNQHDLSIKYSHTYEQAYQQILEHFRHMWHKVLGADNPTFEDFSQFMDLKTDIYKTLFAYLEFNTEKIDNLEYQKERFSLALNVLDSKYSKILRKEALELKRTQNIRRTIFFFGGLGFSMLFKRVIQKI